MSDEMLILGVKYVSSKRAAQATGYAQDHVGYLARSGQVEARRIGGLWYISPASLETYKQNANLYKPQPLQNHSQDSDSIISLDGKDYISASRAAEITGYHQDYVGQLAREGKVLSRQIGNRWFVERMGIVEHKREKNALLAAVQAEAVGIVRSPARENVYSEGPSSHSGYNDAGPHLTYTSDDGDLLPHFARQEEPVDSYRLPADTPGWDSGHRVPIRVFDDSGPHLGRRITIFGAEDPMRSWDTKSGPWNARLSWALSALATVVIVLTIGYISTRNGALYTRGTPFGTESASVLAVGASEAITRMGDILESWLTPEIVYRAKY